MIKELSLSSDFPAWSWEHGNVNASDEQTQYAYDVLMDNGKCSNFSRYVWNDVVDMLANALEGAGIGWSNAYCDAESCKINEPLGALMAYAWNSVAWNIKRLGFVSWEWSRSDGRPGHIGRDDVKGYSVYGEDANNLFAWYVIELTKKLNRLIEVLKDEADFSNFEFVNQSSSVPAVTLAAPAIAAVTANGKGESIAVPNMGTIIVAPHEVSAAGYSYENGILRPTRPLYIPTAEKAESKVWTDFKLLATARMQTEAKVSSEVNTLLAVTKGIRLLDTAAYMMTLSNTLLFSATPFRLTTAAQAFTATYTVLFSADSAILRTDHKSSSESVTTLLKGHSSPLPFVGKSITKDVSTAKIVGVSAAVSPSHGKSEQESEARAFGSAPMGKSLVSESDIVATGKAGRTAPGKSIMHSDSRFIEESTAGHSAPGEHVSESDTTHYAPGNIGHSAPVEKALYSESKIVPFAKAVQAAYLEEQSKAESKGNAEVFAAMAKWVESENESNTAHSGVLIPLDRAPMISIVKPVSKASASVKGLSTKALKTVEKAVSKVVASLSFYQETFEWADPVRTGNNLHITSAWSPWSDGNKLFIDVGIFYEPERNGSDLHIRSAYKSYTDGNDAYIDMDVYYEPVRTGSNLHIRSASSMERGEE